ncbi:hypothetical protein K458DRAFT_411881 [Lentithecium fluviatile CBS 122367]|uniref:Uncharacterized protein n=1 Tax=Lentithecium fluviatile CBS 122367 TaxID=1168545 RepID=A0A6G1JNU3_9PLEO|nr:hypothetical protein K458DRAFT_411881 [Lentithecium fluviatile CBS 122367]
MHLAAVAGNHLIVGYIQHQTVQQKLAMNLRHRCIRTGRMPLHEAIVEGHLDAVRCLISAGSDLEQWIVNGLIALELAEKYRQEEIATIIRVHRRSP